MCACFRLSLLNIITYRRSLSFVPRTEAHATSPSATTHPTGPLAISLSRSDPLAGYCRHSADTADSFRRRTRVVASLDGISRCDPLPHSISTSWVLHLTMRSKNAHRDRVDAVENSTTLWPTTPLLVFLTRRAPIARPPQPPRINHSSVHEALGDLNSTLSSCHRCDPPFSCPVSLDTSPSLPASPPALEMQTYHPRFVSAASFACPALRDYHRRRVFSSFWYRVCDHM